MNRPNILLMIAHDLGRHLGCYGVPTVQTPNLDRMAGEGARFARSFCVAPQCSPSRAALFTGRTPHQNGVMGLTHSHFAWDLHEDERHLAGLLRDAGWHTALAGLQHETRRPQEMGWTEIIPSDAPVPGPPRTGGDKVAAQIANFLERRKGEDAPFYLQVGFFEPHRAPGTPGDFGNLPSDEEKGVFVPPYLVDDDAARDEFRHYQGAIRKLDGAVGEILAALDADADQRENTLVLFTTDHGIPFPRAKCSVYDPGLETCLLLRWPRGGGVTGGTVYEPMIPHTDILPTLLDLTGVAAPQNIVGRSFAPLLRGEEYEPRTEIFGEMTFHDYCDPVRCVRTDRWKLLAAFSNARSFMDPSQQWRPRTVTRVPDRPHLAYHPPIELYDLESDPLETNNLADAPEHAPVRADLLRRLRTWMEATNDPLLTGIPLSPIHRTTLAALREENGLPTEVTATTPK